MLLLTICLLIVICLISYALFDRDLLAPPTVVSLGFLFSALCAYYNEERWALDFASETTWTIVAGLSAFVVGGLLAVVLASLPRLDRVGLSHKISPVTPIHIEWTKTIFIVVVQVLMGIVLFMKLREITGQTSWNDVVATYRDLTGWQQDLNDESLVLPWLLRQLLEANFVFGLVYAYVVANNIAAKQKTTLLNWLPILLCTGISFMQGYRSDMLRLWVALLIVIYTLKKRTVGWKSSKEIKKMIRIMALSVIAIAVLFVALRATVGRAETDWEALHYLTHYAGSPVAAFDLFLKNPPAPSDIWGKETFFDMNRALAGWFDREELKYIFYKEFRTSPNGSIIGNIYTALRPPYYDFGGFGGMVVYMLIMGAFFTFFYAKVRNRSGKCEIELGLLFYSHIAYTFFLYFYNLYNGFLSIGYVKFIVEVLAVRWFLTGFHFHKRYSIRLSGNRTFTRVQASPPRSDDRS